MFCELIDKQLQAGVLKPAQSEWTNLIVLVPKKGDTLQFCKNHRHLNAAIIPNIDLMPRMDGCIDS